MLNRLKVFFDRLDVTKKGYVVNKYLTNGAFVLLLLYMFVLVGVDGPSVLLGGVYAECPVGGGVCSNPFYDSSCLVTGVVCEPEFVVEGWSTGVKPSFASRFFPLVALLVVFGSLGLNHLLYNKGWRKDV